MPIYKKKDKNGKIIKNEKGIELWYFRDYYTDIYGNKKQYKSGLIAGKKEVQDAERKWLEDLYKPVQQIASISFKDAFCEWQNYRKTELKETSYYGYKKRVDKYIYNHFENYKLHSIKINAINEWYNYVKKLNMTIKYKNVLIKDVISFFTYCSNNFDYDYKIIAKIQKFRDDTPKQQRRESEWNFWTYDDWCKFIDVVDDYNYKIYFTTLYFTGMRFGEFDALNWNDYDPINKTISITKSLSNKVDGKVFTITTPKTKNSVRIIDLDDSLNSMLIEYKKYKEKHSYNFSSNDFMFGDIKYLPKTTFAEHLKKYIDISGVKYITPHGFRHSHVSLLIHLGCDSRDVAERVGDTVDVIENTYYHIFPQKKKMTVNKLNNL